MSARADPQFEALGSLPDAAGSTCKTRRGRIQPSMTACSGGSALLAPFRSRRHQAGCSPRTESGCPHLVPDRSRCRTCTRSSSERPRRRSPRSSRRSSRIRHRPRWAGDFEQTVRRIEPDLTYLAQRLTESPEQLAEARDFPDAVRKLSQAALGTMEEADTMRQNALEMGRASRSLKRVGQRLAVSFAKMVAASAHLTEWRKLVDQLPSRSPGADDACPTARLLSSC